MFVVNNINNNQIANGFKTQFVQQQQQSIPVFGVAPDPAISTILTQRYPNSFEGSNWNNGATQIGNFFSQAREVDVTASAAQTIASLPQRVTQTAQNGQEVSWYGNTVMLSNDGMASCYGQNPNHYATSETTQYIAQGMQAALPAGAQCRVVDVSQFYAGPYRPSNPQNVLVYGSNASQVDNYEGVGTSFNVGLLAKMVANYGPEQAYQMHACEVRNTTGIQLDHDAFIRQFGGASAK